MTSRSAEDGRSLEARVLHASLATRLFGVAADRVALGPYQLLRRIGAGGMGTVFEANDNRNGKRLALKVLHNRGLHGLTRLKREFRALADIQHPNLVRLYELSVHDDEAFITMELIRGGSIFDYVRPEGALHTERFLGTLRQLVDAISSLHAAGTLHCDLKPANLLSQDDGRLVLLDFGLARALGEHADGLASGTPAYVAPERLDGHAPSEASDWYSAGVLLRQLLTGALPADPWTASGSPEPSPLAPGAELPPPIGELCARLRDRDPLRRPRAPELRAALGLAPAPRPRPLRPAGDSHFLGREPELARLREAFESCTQGLSVVFHLRGEPGIGKSALARHFIAELQAETPVAVLSGRCHEREYLPYNAIDGLADSLAQQLSLLSGEERARLAPDGSAELARLFPVLSSALGAGESPDLDLHHIRHRGSAALRALLGELARRRPLIVHLDDLQWGDADSAHLLQELMRSGAPSPMLLVASYRRADAAQSACVQALLEARPASSPDVRVLDLEPLSQAEALELARSLGANRFDAAQLEALSRESEGSPLFLRALVQHHGAGEPFQHTSFQELLRATLRQLEAPGHELLQLLALANRPLARDFLLRAAEGEERRGEVDWHDHLMTLQQIGLLRIAPGARENGLESYHDRVREAVAENIEPNLRRSLHARLARTEAVSPAPDPEFLAYQYEGAEQLDTAARYAELAGDRALSAVALDRAAKLYAMALRCGGTERPAALVEKLANATAYAGRSGQAAPLYLEAAGPLAVEQPRSLRLHMRGADMLLRSGQFDESIAVLKPVLRAVGVRFVTTTAGAILSLLIDLWRLHRRGIDARTRRAPSALEEARGEICFALGYPMTTSGQVRSWALQLRSMLFAAESGTDAQLARSLASYAMLRATLLQGTDTDQDALLARAWELACGVPDSADVKGWVLGLRAATYMTRGEYHRCWVAAREAQAWLAEHCVDTTWRLSELDLAIGAALISKGDVGELRRALELAAQRTRESDSHYQAACVRALANPLWLARDDSDKALSELRALHHIWPTSALATLMTWRRIYTYLYRGEARAAWDAMSSEWSASARKGYQRVGPWNVALPALRSTVALACIKAQGKKRRLLRYVAEDIAWLKHQRTSVAKPMCALLEGGHFALDSRREQSAESYAQAVQGFDREQMPSYAMIARMRQAELIGGAPAAALREEALAWFAAQGIVRPESWVRMYAPIGAERV